MKPSFLLISLVLPTLLFSQNGFIQSYDFGESGVTFHNMLLVEDTLVICGRIAVEEELQVGLLFAKLDTFGNVLDHRIHFDELGDNYSFEDGYEMIKTVDGGYALVGQMFGRQFPVLIKLDVNGNLEFVQEYPDETVYNIRHWNLIEMQHGFITTGVKQQMSDGLWDSFIMGTDQQGNKLWETSYGELGLWDDLKGIQKINENEFLITGYTFNTTSQVQDRRDLYVIPKAIRVDALGQVLWEWEGEIDFVGGLSAAFVKIQPTQDGNWIHDGASSTILEDNSIVFQGEIVKRDTNFNTIWHTSFGQPTSNMNNLVDVASCPDGGWVAVGQYINVVSEGPIWGYYASMIAKVSADGDSLWSRLDTLFNPTMIASEPYLSGVVVHPSGSIFTCGRVDKLYPDPRKFYGWLIKVDKDGCMEPGCNPMVSTTNLKPLLEKITVYPNPVVDKLTISGEGEFTIDLISPSGQVLITKKAQNEGDLLVGKYPAGTYFLRISKGTTSLMKKIVKSR